MIRVWQRLKKELYSMSDSECSWEKFVLSCEKISKKFAKLGNCIGEYLEETE